MDALSALQQYYGYSQFRPGQLEIVESVINRQDSLALLPTGGGKSLCFQIPGLVLGGTTLVVTPLISLMADQVKRLQSLKIQATYLSSTLDKSEQLLRLNLLKEQRWQFVYLSPELLLTAKFLKYSQSVNIPLIAIDEAHCISEWGHDFRPEYQQIRKYVDQLNTKPTLIAVTATATPTVVADILISLRLNNPRIFTRSFKRENIAIKVIGCNTYTEKLQNLLYWLLRNQTQCGIIYSLTRNAAEDVFSDITYFLPQIKIAVYHGGISAEQRERVQNAFISQKIQLISATSAFGMGIDKANIRYVIHNQLPLTLEEYYQEVGRAGRDGFPSEAILLFHPPDAQPAWSLIGNNPVKKHGFKIFLKYCQTRSCRSHQLLSHFGELKTPNCKQCDICYPTSVKPQPIEIAHFSRFSRNVELKLAAHNLKRKSVISNQLLQWLFLLKPVSVKTTQHIPGVGEGWMKEIYPIIKNELDSLHQRQMLI